MRGIGFRRASFLATLLLASQAPLAVLHEWRVGAVESAFHLTASTPPASSTVSPKNLHRHHQDGNCAFCLLLTRAGAPPPAAVTAPRTTPDRALRPFDASTRAHAPFLSGTPPRGPPARS